MIILCTSGNSSLDPNRPLKIKPKEQGSLVPLEPGEGGHPHAVFAFLKPQPTAIPFTPSKFTSLSNGRTGEKLLRISSISRVATDGLSRNIPQSIYSGFGSASTLRSPGCHISRMDIRFLFPSLCGSPGSLCGVGSCFKRVPGISSASLLLQSN